jgi:hypothetical protein
VRRSTFAFIGLLCSLSLPARAALWPSTVQRIERDLHAPEVEVRRRAAQLLRDLPHNSGARLARAALMTATSTCA